MDPAGSREDPPASSAPEEHTVPPARDESTLTHAQARGAEEVGRPPGESTGLPPWIPRLLLAVVITAFAAYATFSLIRQLQQLLLWLVAALFLSFALEPAVNWLVGRGWRRGAAAGAVMAGLALLGLFSVALMVPLVIDQVQELVERLPGWLDQASVYTERWFDVELTSEKILENIASAQADVQGIAANVASVGAFLLGLIFQVLTIGLFTFYLVADGPRFRRGVCSILPPRRQHEVLAAWNVAIDKTGGYLYSRLLLALVNAAFTFAVLTALGVPFAVPLALWQGFVSQFIPVVGTYIAAAVPLLVALLGDPWDALFFLIFVLVYQQIENYLLAPRITAKTMQLHPAVAFGAALAGGAISGLIGAFMALPAAAVIQATVSTYLRRHEVVETELTREDEEEDDEAEEAMKAAGEDGGERRPYGILGRVSGKLRRDEG
ncbi:MAG TPA: AI-2E family transporter [Actinomycetota bacterium]|nr:AI-2E family transporter [Actinomycetota bacterium]